MLLQQKLDDSLGLTDMAAALLADPRTGQNGRHRLAGLLRQSIFSQLGGYEDVNDADRRRHDPVMRLYRSYEVIEALKVGRKEWTPDGRDRLHARFTTARPPSGALVSLAELRFPDPVRSKQTAIYCTNTPTYATIWGFQQFQRYEQHALSSNTTTMDPVRPSRDGHTFHERWAARRALQLVFPKDDLCAIAVEGLSTSEVAQLDKVAEEIADIVLYYGSGDSFSSCRALQTLQFKYRASYAPVTSSYLKKTILKFAESLLSHEEHFGVDQTKEKLSFSFVTNAPFSEQLWEAIRCLKDGHTPGIGSVLAQYDSLSTWCRGEGVDAGRLMSLIEFRASTKDLPATNRELQGILSDWTPGVDSQARMRLRGLEELIRQKAGLAGQRNNLVKREDVLDALGCGEEEDLFPAETQFVEIGTVVERKALSLATQTIANAQLPVFIHAGAGVGKTVFIQSLAQHLGNDYEVVVFDCFGGGAYRAEDQARHLPKIGLLQIVNELASRGLCDPQLPSDGDRVALVRAARRRLEQAAATVRRQSAKQGILVIVDAADNAQGEADRRNEDAFPRLLLASLSREPIDGVKLVLTARTHRMADVIGRSEVEQFELGPFADDETRHFLNSRRVGVTELEVSTALARSGGNARVLEYLVASWDENISAPGRNDLITVEQLIAQRCEKITRYLDTAGWDIEEVTQLFTALSLLPPPIPLDEMATALGWPQPKVNDAVVDLAPMLEVSRHGAIFRDEPTETFIHEAYASEAGAQQEIAERLYSNQGNSVYAAEALPHFLVVIEDSDRAYALSRSEAYPDSIQSAYGRRRLKLFRLYAALSLAAKEQDRDRMLKLTMQLAQVAAANARGDEFIRRMPGVSVHLGDQDASRRVFQDRSGWRGARDARLSIAFAFLGEREEADIHQDRAIGWINWHIQNARDDERHRRAGPSTPDFAAVVFLSILKGDLGLADRNIARWNFRFSVSVCRYVIGLAEQYEALCGVYILDKLAEFASSKDFRSLALQLTLLASPQSLDVQQLKRLSRAASTVARNADSDLFEEGFDHQHQQQAVLADAALSALIHKSRQSAANIVSALKPERISGFEYRERYGPFREWVPVLSACVSAWSAGQALKFHHLLPGEVDVTRQLKSVGDRVQLIGKLKELEQRRPPGSRLTSKGNGNKKLFTQQECENIVKGIEEIICLARNLQDVILARRDITATDFSNFIELWGKRIKLDERTHYEEASDKIVKAVGLEMTKIFLSHARSVSEQDAKRAVEILSRGRFTIDDKIDALILLARHSNLSGLAGAYAQQVADDIRKDESIDQQSQHYSRLARALLPMSIAEAQEYFRQGLSQLDQMGGDDYDTIYSLLLYAARQHGGWLRHELGHRLMNLCQTIFHYEPSKFGWTLFGQAIAQSVGFQGLYKLIRWEDQDVAERSYGLPQLACFLAERGHLDARRAAYILLLCENQGWYDWKLGDGLTDLFEVAHEADRPRIYRTVFESLVLEHPQGGHEYLWVSLEGALEMFPDAAGQFEKDRLNDLIVKASDQKRKGKNRESADTDCGVLEARPEDADEKQETEAALQLIIEDCDPLSPESVDDAIRTVREDRRFMVNAGKCVIERLRARCAYSNRPDFIAMLVELSELEFASLVEAVRDCVSEWESSSASIASSKPGYVTAIFENKGSSLFRAQYSSVLREINRLKEFCGDPDLVVNLLFDTVSKERIDLTGGEWLELATALSPHAQPSANLEALEDLLSGPAGQIGSEIGEGPYRGSLAPAENQPTIIAELTWHLLGNEDAFVRWTAARSVKGLADLGLHEDITALVQCFDRDCVAALMTDGLRASYLNAQQWLLMGLARACLHHGIALGYLKESLERLSRRDDIHAVNKVHIVRCLKHISGRREVSPEVSELEREIFVPKLGFKTRHHLAKSSRSTSGFDLDYDFLKYEMSAFQRVFDISRGEAIDVTAAEITSRWPEATDITYFPGRVHYLDRHADRFESYRHSVQKHAMLSAATNLSKKFPVVRDDNDPADNDPWGEFLQRHDAAFEDGSWLADRKDAMPAQALAPLVVGKKNEDVLETDNAILRRIGLLEAPAGTEAPLFGSWKSVDGVRVRFVAALTQPRGSVGRCASFSKRPHHDIWLPTFGSDGCIDRSVRESEFEPLIWLPERYPNGIDEGDQRAARFASTRPRIGKDLTRILGLKADHDQREWFAPDRSSVLRSQVWGEWERDRDEHRAWVQNDGMILWARPGWLDAELADINRSLVYYIDLYRPRPARRYEDSKELQRVWVALRSRKGDLRLWKATRKSEPI